MGAAWRTRRRPAPTGACSAPLVDLLAAACMATGLTLWGPVSSRHLAGRDLRAEQMVDLRPTICLLLQSADRMAARPCTAANAGRKRQRA